MVEAGLIEKLKQNWWPRNDECSIEGGGDGDGILYVGDVLGIFLILIFGKEFVLL